MKTLRPILVKQKEWDDLETRIKRVFRRILFKPVLRALDESETLIKNSRDHNLALIRAIKSGRITFYRGAFRGEFSAAISKELKLLGAIWKKDDASFRIESRDLPKEIYTAIKTNQKSFDETVKKINRVLSKDLSVKITDSLKSEDIFSRALWKVDNEISKTLKNITVTPKLSKAERMKISREWQKNLDRWVDDLTREEVQRLRLTVAQNAFAGNRYEAIVTEVQKSYGITARKARFIAKRETSLLVSKYKETRYQAAGIKKYRWACVAGSAAHPVRPSHKILEGKVFRWDRPPITTAPDQPARRNNPGEDYNCRCYAIPIVDFK